MWLATCTPRDLYVSSEKDPDRQNTLRSFMSAKYEQKRYYVDPSKLPQSELNEIQAQTARALSSSSSSISNSSSTMQKSPSLSSASSASSLSLHNNNHNNPSPVLNNSRNSSSQIHMNSHNRLVNSITLPDIKPLSSLIGPVNLASTTGNHINGNKSNNFVAGGSLGLSNGKQTSTPVPINFINNLSSLSTPSQQQNGGPVMCNNDPWEGDNNNFNANFADFDNFNSEKSNGGGFGGISNGANDLNGSNFANFDAFQHQPLLPANNGNSTGGMLDSHSTKTLPVSANAGTTEDKYAALKDLDNIFKQGFSKYHSFLSCSKTKPKLKHFCPLISRWGVDRKRGWRKSGTIEFSVISGKFVIDRDIRFIRWMVFFFPKSTARYIRVLIIQVRSEQDEFLFVMISILLQ